MKQPTADEVLAWVGRQTDLELLQKLFWATEKRMGVLRHNNRLRQETKDEGTRNGSLRGGLTT